MNIHRYRWSPGALVSPLAKFLGGQVEVGYDDLELTLEDLRNMTPILRGEFAKISLTSPDTKEVKIECSWLCEQIIEPDDNGKLKATWRLKPTKKGVPHELALRWTVFYNQPDEERFKLKWGEEAVHFCLPDDVANLVFIPDNPKKPTESGGKYIPVIWTPQMNKIRLIFAVLLIKKLKLKPLKKH